MDLFVEARAQLVGTGRLRREIDDGEIEWARGIDHLEGLAILQHQPRAQDLVARDEGGEALLERGAIEGAGDAQGGGNVVEGAAGEELIVEPESLLGKGERQRLVPWDRP